MSACVGIDELLDAIVRDLPPPVAGVEDSVKGNVSKEDPLKALVFDSFYDPSKGVVLVAVVRVSAKQLGYVSIDVVMGSCSSLD